MIFINDLESGPRKVTVKIYMEIKLCDVLRTYADVSDLRKGINFKPRTSIENGLQKFVEYYKEYYKVEIKKILRGAKP